MGRGLNHYVDDDSLCSTSGLRAGFVNMIDRLTSDNYFLATRIANTAQRQNSKMPGGTSAENRFDSRMAKLSPAVAVGQSSAD